LRASGADGVAAAYGRGKSHIGDTPLGEKVPSMAAKDEPVTTPQRQFEEKLRLEEGFLEEPGGREVGCDPQEEQCAPSDYVEEPFTDDGTPGTADDLPYSLGVEEPPPADEHMVPDSGSQQIGHTRSFEQDSDKDELGSDEEKELWREQKPLVDEDERSGLKLEGFAQTDIPKIMDAMGDEAAEQLPDSPEGTSATGKGTEPEHGGFPQR
jgi:hypothetical protein